MMQVDEQDIIRAFTGDRHTRAVDRGLYRAEVVVW